MLYDILEFMLADQLIIFSLHTNNELNQLNNRDVTCLISIAMYRLCKKLWIAAFNRIKETNMQ